MAITISTAGRNAMCDALVDLVDPSGKLVLYTSGSVEVATLPLSATAFGAAATGVATAAAITDDTSATGGDLTGGHHRFETAASAEIWRGNIGTSGSDLNISSLTIGAGETVSCTGYTVTVPAS